MGRRQFARHEWAQKAAYLLGCTLEELSSSIFKHQAKGLQHSTSFRGPPDEASHGDGLGKNTANVGISIYVELLLKGFPLLIWSFFLRCRPHFACFQLLFKNWVSWKKHKTCISSVSQALKSQLWSVWRPWHQDFTLSFSHLSSPLLTG